MYNLSRFKIDEHYVGEPPAVEITITNMNDNVDDNFLRNLLMKCGPTEEQIIYRHPRTQRRLGIARIVFVDVKSARTCIEKYNQQSVMGNVMNVFHDAFGKQCKQILSEASSEKKQPKTQTPTNPRMSQQASSTQSFKQKEELSSSHLNESDIFYQAEYNNPYSRSSHIAVDHKPDETDWNDSRDKYEEYNYETDDHRHYRYDKKTDRRWDSKSSRYYKSEKDRERRSERRDYRGHRDERDRDNSRRRDYDYERKDRDSRDRRERDHRSRDSKYRDYKKSEREYVPSAESSFTYGSSSNISYAVGSHNSHNYSSFDASSSSSFHQYPPLP